MKIDQYCQRQRCKHFELDQVLVCFRVARVCQRQLGFLVFIRIQHGDSYVGWDDARVGCLAAVHSELETVARNKLQIWKTLRQTIHVVFGPSLWRSLAPPTFVAGRDRPSGGAPRDFSPALLAPRLSSQFTVSLQSVCSQFAVSLQLV